MTRSGAAHSPTSRLSVHPGHERELAQDAAVQAADTILLTVPSQLGVDYNAAMLETIAKEIAPAVGWSTTKFPEPVA